MAKTNKAGNSGITAKKPRGKPFKAGQSGNPNGRPKIAPEAKAMLKAAAPEAVQLLIDTMQDVWTKPELRIKCAETIIDRVYGKATQPIEGDLSGGITITLAGDVSDYGA